MLYENTCNLKNMSIIDLLSKTKGKYKENANVGKMCWFGTKGLADIFYIPEDKSDLQFFLQNKPKNAPITILGAGSNMLVSEKGVKGVVIKLGAGFKHIKHDGHEVKAGAANLDMTVANYAKDNSIGGLEFLSGIPGTIGGALAMNAGAYSNDTASILIETTAINFSGKIKTFLPEEIGYKYRGKTLSNEWIFLEAKFQGIQKDKADIAKEMEHIQSQRSLSQPIKSKTGGSTFKNPPNQKAWELIDKAGCRGLQIGGAKVSELHCNFLINDGNATASDMEKLIQTVKDKVYKTTGVLLEEEIKIIGNKTDKN